MDYYRIMTLDAAVILAEGKKTEDGRSYRFELDFNNVVLREKTVIKIENHADCALFRQIRIAAGKNDESDRKDIFDKLIYLDFSNVLKGTKKYTNPMHRFLVNMDSKSMEEAIEERGAALMENGFRLKLKGQSDSDGMVFYPFDRSASMSKNGMITFLAGELYDEVDERIRLGIDFNNIEVIPSKYYAYRGLYLTNGRQISGLELDHEKVIVIDDDINKVIADVVTCTLRYDEKGNLLVNSKGKLPLTNEDGSLTVIEGKEIKLNCFDGEGIISEEYAEKINDELFGKDSAYSFQIRMPFVKGVLHKVDFKRFVMDQLGLENLDGISISDYFKQDRDLSKVEIILTRSMFKGAEWIKLDADEIKEPDPMKLYFERFNKDKYDHALYISNTSRGFGGTDEVKMNYQFLNTLEFEGDELQELLEHHYGEARRLPEDVDIARRTLIRRQEKPDQNDDDDGDEEGLRLPAWKYALQKNPAFIYDSYVKTILEKMSMHMEEDGRLGRINVRGTIGFLSRDLLAFMIHVMKQIKGVSTDDAVYNLEEKCLKDDQFYLPGHIGYEMDENKYYGILRNPHLSRNEQCLLKPLHSSIYDKYFGDLNGMIMVPYNSIVPAALGGADFDGDTVKLIMEDSINEAIRRGAYDTVDGGKYKRKYPIADIPSPPGRKEKVKSGKGEKGKTDYDQFRRAALNMIGHISNASLMIAKYEYMDPDPLKRSEYKNWGALCTIATGLEIDSVKTGVKPDLSAIDKKRGEEQDEFLLNKYKLEEEKKEEKGKKWKRKKTAGDHRYPNPADQDLRPIDLLEYYYHTETLGGVSEEKKTGTKKISKRDAKRMMFHLETGQKNLNDEDEELINNLKKIRNSYIEFKDQITDIKRARKRVDADHFISVIKTLLYTEYDNEVDELPISGEKIDEAIRLTISECEDQTYDYREIISKCDALKENWEDWIFAEGFDKKRVMLSRFLDVDQLSAASVEILCDNYDNGYHILKHILQHIHDSIEYDLGYLELIETLKDKDESDKVKKLGGVDKELYILMCEEYDFKEPLSEWERDAKEMCRERISELFDGNMKNAAEFILRNDSKLDRNHKSFWNWFNPEDIQHLIIPESTIDQEAENA